MPEGKSISFVEGEYPQLDGLESGAQVKMTAQATLQKGEGGMSLVLNTVEFETEGQVDKDLNQMRGQDATADAYAKSGVEEDF